MKHNLTQPHLFRGVRDLFAKNEFWMKLPVAKYLSNHIKLEAPWAYCSLNGKGACRPNGASSRKYLSYEPIGATSVRRWTGVVKRWPGILSWQMGNINCEWWQLTKVVSRIIPSNFFLKGVWILRGRAYFKWTSRGLEKIETLMPMKSTRRA